MCFLPLAFFDGIPIFTQEIQKHKFVNIVCLFLKKNTTVHEKMPLDKHCHAIKQMHQKLNFVAIEHGNEIKKYMEMKL